VDWPAIRRRAEGVVSAMRGMNHKNFNSAGPLDSDRLQLRVCGRARRHSLAGASTRTGENRNDGNVVMLAKGNT